MKNIGMAPGGQLVCPSCGATQFSNRRTRGAKLAAGITVGVGALAVPKRMQCLGCREYLKSPPVLISSPANASGGDAPVGASGYVEVILVSSRSTAMLPTVLEALHPNRNSKERREAIRDALKTGTPVRLDVLPRPQADAVAAKFRTKGFVVETRFVEDTTATQPPVVSETSGDVIAQLRGLGELRDAGVLSDDEFETKKAQLLDRM